MKVDPHTLDMRFSIESILGNSKLSAEEIVRRVALCCDPDTAQVKPGFVYQNAPMKRGRYGYPDYLASDSSSEYVIKELTVTEHNLFYPYRIPREKGQV